MESAIISRVKWKLEVCFAKQELSWVYKFAIIRFSEPAKIYVQRVVLATVRVIIFSSI